MGNRWVGQATPTLPQASYGKDGKGVVERREKPGNTHAVPRLHTGKARRGWAQGGRGQAKPTLPQASYGKDGKGEVERREKPGKAHAVPRLHTGRLGTAWAKGGRKAGNAWTTSPIPFQINYLLHLILQEMTCFFHR